MKRYIESYQSIEAVSTNSPKYFKQLKPILDKVVKAWKKWANIDVDISEDGKVLTFPDKSNKPVNIRIEVELIPEYHIYNDVQDEVYSTQNINDLSTELSDLIKDYR